MSQSANDEKPKLTLRFHVMLPHPTQNRVLVLPYEDGWTLPHFEPEERFPAMVGEVNRFVSEHLGAQTSVLRCAHFYIDREVKRRAEAIYSLENHNPDWQAPAEARWIGLGDIEALTWQYEEQKAGVDTWLRERESGIYPPERPPWALESWLETASDWIRSRLGILNIEQTGPPEQLKTWGISCLMRVPTYGGTYYFKAVPPIFSLEPLITQSLVEEFPDHVPAPVAMRIEPRESWMLLKDLEGELLRDTAEPQEWGELVALLARLQIRSIDRVESLLASGCADRRVKVLSDQLETLFSDPHAINELTAEEIDTLRRAIPDLRAMCRELLDLGIPETLIHGDFHGINVVRKNDTHIIFDWTDAAISHPFFDLRTMLHYDIGPDIVARCRDRYLQEWSAYATPGALLRAFELSVPLGSLHHAVSYRNIFVSMEPSARWEMWGGTTHWLRKCIEWLAEHRAAGEEKDEESVGVG